MEDREPSRKRRTAWHPLFVRVLRAVLPRDRYDITGEYLLGAQPQRIDVVVVRKILLDGPLQGRILARVLSYLGLHTLIELKGPTDTLDRDDFLWFRGYAAQYCAENGLYERGNVHMIVVANRLTQPFRTLAEHHGAQIAEIDAGVHRLSGLEHPYHVVEAEVAGDHVLHLFSRSFLKAPGRLFSLMDEGERVIFTLVLGEVQQLRRNREDALRYADYQEFDMSMQEFIDTIMEQLPAEIRLKGLPAEEIVSHLSAEERLKGLRLTNEDIARLSPEDREYLRQLFSK